MSFYHDAAMELERLRRQLQELKQKMEVLPKGDISCRVNGNGFKWYRVLENMQPEVQERRGPRKVHQYIYIPKSNAQYAAGLALRKYYAAEAEDLQNSAAAIERLLQRMDRGSHHAEQLMTQKGLAALVEPQISKGEEEMRAWAAQEYVRCADHPEHLKIPTVGGVNVRSKSEALIANMLSERGLAYRYECLLNVGTRTFYPDFTIWNPQTGGIVIWEHFGMLGMQAYQSQVLGKIEAYVMNGYLPYRNLITTYETGEEPFDVEYASRIVKITFGR